MSDGFDPTEAAARATGELVDTDADDLEDVDDVDGADPSEADVDDGGDASASDGAESTAAVFLLPLFTADEAGPTASTLQSEAGLGERAALFVDGLLDYALHFSDRLADELEDTLGPVGKWGRAASDVLEGAGDDSEDASTDRGDDSEDVDEDVGGDLPGEGL